MKTQTSVYRKIANIIGVMLVVYVAIGLVFHFTWQHALTDCRESREAQGEFVEPEVFSGLIGLFFDVSFWPVYGMANIQHWGTPFATPCINSSQN